MKKHLAALLLLVPSLTQAQTPPHAPAPEAYPYLITGQIGHLQAPAKVYLVQNTARRWCQPCYRQGSLP
jgi:hypothetical protein